MKFITALKNAASNAGKFAEVHNLIMLQLEAEHKEKIIINPAAFSLVLLASSI